MASEMGLARKKPPLLELTGAKSQYSELRKVAYRRVKGEVSIVVSVP